MQVRTVSTAVITSTILIMATLATDVYANAPQSSSADNSKVAAKPKPQASQPKLVDINSASATELKTLPGIGKDEAARIIAARPFGSKAWLVTKGILPESLYPTISHLVVAKQPFKDAAKNVDMYRKMQSK